MLQPTLLGNQLNQHGSQSTFEVTDEKILVSVNSQTSIGTGDLLRVQSQKHCISIKDGENPNQSSSGYKSPPEYRNEKLMQLAKTNPMESPMRYA